MMKPLVMMAAGAAVVLALGVAIAQTKTEKSGGSTATITQEPGTNMKRTVTKTPDGQTIVQQSGGGKANIKQSTSADDDECKDKTAAKKGGKTAAADDDDCD